MAGEDVKPNVNRDQGAAASPEGQDVKPNVADAIQLVVKDQHGGEVHFKVKKHTRFNKIFDAYCTKKNVQPNSVRFVFDGTRLNPQSTPDEHDMENDDTIEAFAEQIGGGRQ